MTFDVLVRRGSPGICSARTLPGVLFNIILFIPFLNYTSFVKSFCICRRSVSTLWCLTKTKIMKILQLCVFTNHWSPSHEVESWDLRKKRNVFDFPVERADDFDLIVAAPPCDQFTRANSRNWQEYPDKFINLAAWCIGIMIYSGKLWLLEQPPGRFETFFPFMSKYRLVNFMYPHSNKEQIIYGNVLLMAPVTERYGFPSSDFGNKSKKQREAWDPFLVEYFEKSICYEKI